jgi:hypothetical protein
MPIGFRKSKTVGGVRVTGTKRGLSASTGAGPLRVSSRRRASLRLPGGLHYRSGCLLPLLILAVICIITTTGVNKVAMGRFWGAFGVTGARMVR